MITIRILQDVLIKGQHVDAGKTISVADPLAKFLIGIDKAVAVVDSPVIETAVALNSTEKAVLKRKRKSEDE